MKSRGRDIFRVFHRVDGKRVPSTFSTLMKAKAHAKAILKELYGKTKSDIHLTHDQARDWQSATNIMRQAGLRTSLETAIRHYYDSVNVVGGVGLLTDVARQFAESRGLTTVTPVKLSALREAYLTALKARELSTRYLEAQRSHTGQFLEHAGGGVMSDKVTREILQEFLDRKKVGARAKENLLNAVKAMMVFGKLNRTVPEHWDEADRIIMAAVKPGLVTVYTAEELKKLLAAAPKKFRPILALAAFAGIRSSELELLCWEHIRLLEPKPKDRLIRLDVPVTDPAGRRTVEITKRLTDWLAGPYKPAGKVWTGGHYEFYRMQQSIAKEAGVVWKQNALRHTCISAKVATTGNVPQVAFESGNSVQVIKLHYLNLMRPTEAEAWFAVSRSVVGEYRR